MISLWILAILVVFAIGLGHRASINLRLARYQRDRLKATYLARAGINRAIVELENDKNTNDYDGLNETWSTGIDSNNNRIFENIEIKEDSEETFTVKHIYDEERKININTASKEMLTTLLVEKAGIQTEDAQDIANLILTWRGQQEEDIPNFKNGVFTVAEELLIILEYFYEQSGKDKKESQEEAQNIYNNVKDLITVYGNNKININTASLDVIKVVFRVTGSGPNIQATSAEIEDLVIRIDNYRKGEPGYFTVNDMNANEIKKRLELGGEINNQTKIINQLVSSQALIAVSENFRIESIGKVGNITKNITAIFERQNKKFIYWHEN